MGVRGLHHIGISVPDLVSAERFYTTAFGFGKVLDKSWEDSDTADQVLGLRETSARGVNLWAGNVVIELFEFKTPQSRPQDADHPVNDHGISHLCLQVDDIGEEVARLGTMGMAFHSPPLGDDSGWFVYGRDPWGNVIELIQLADDTVPNVDGWQFRRLPTGHTTERTEDERPVLSPPSPLYLRREPARERLGVAALVSRDSSVLLGR